MNVDSSRHVQFKAFLTVCLSLGCALPYYTLFNNVSGTKMASNIDLYKEVQVVDHALSLSLLVSYSPFGFLVARIFVFFSLISFSLTFNHIEMWNVTWFDLMQFQFNNKINYFMCAHTAHYNHHNQAHQQQQQHQTPIETRSALNVAWKIFCIESIAYIILCTMYILCSMSVQFTYLHMLCVVGKCQNKLYTSIFREYSLSFTIFVLPCIALHLLPWICKCVYVFFKFSLVVVVRVFYICTVMYRSPS